MARLFFPPSQLHTGETAPRRVLAEEVDPDGFWTIASRSGKRVAAIDLPWTVAPAALNGIFVAEWAVHDRWFGPASYPAGLSTRSERRHGEYPVHLCDDDYGASLAERARLAADLLDGVEVQTRMLLDLLGTGGLGSLRVRVRAVPVLRPQPLELHGDEGACSRPAA